MAETVYLTMSRQHMLDIRAKADLSGQPNALYYGQRIIGYHEFTTGSGRRGGHWHATVVLADGTRVVIDEDPDEVRSIPPRHRDAP
jgi:hypothetical protein